MRPQPWAYTGSIEAVCIHRQHAKGIALMYATHARNRGAGAERDEEWQEMLLRRMVARGARGFAIAHQHLHVAARGGLCHPVAETADPRRRCLPARPVELAQVVGCTSGSQD